MINTLHNPACASASRVSLSAMVMLVFLAGSLALLGACGSTKLYVPPENPEAGTVVIVNDIYDPGFYVEIDEKDAGFLQGEREILVKPGQHTVKIFNQETTVTENSMTTSHTFEYDVKVEKNDRAQITLAWDDPHYRKKVENVVKSIREKEDEKEKHRRTAPERGMPY